MRNTNWLGNIFIALSEVFEKLNPSAYRFLAAILPYITPYPVAWLTSYSASEFLGFPPNISFIFVFALEGIGLWFTGLLVDAVVDWIRSRNVKTFVLVVIFGAVIIAYITILINLNVTLENAVAAGNPVKSRIITLLCYLPLLTGVGNGYYKLKLDAKEKELEALEYSRNLEREVRQEKSKERLEKLKIKSGKFPQTIETFQQSVESFQKVSNSTRKFPESFYEVSSWRKLSTQLSRDEMEMLANMNPQEMTECAKEIGKEYRTISNWRTSARVILGDQHEL